MQVKVFDRNGNVLVAEAVDARELVASGEYSYDEPESQEPVRTRGRGRPRVESTVNVMDIVPDSDDAG